MISAKSTDKLSASVIQWLIATALVAAIIGVGILVVRPIVSINSSVEALVIVLFIAGATYALTLILMQVGRVARSRSYALLVRINFITLILWGGLLMILIGIRELSRT